MHVEMFSSPLFFTSCDPLTRGYAALVVEVVFLFNTTFCGGRKDTAWNSYSVVHTRALRKEVLSSSPAHGIAWWTEGQRD